MWVKVASGAFAAATKNEKGSLPSWKREAESERKRSGSATERKWQGVRGGGKGEPRCPRLSRLRGTAEEEVSGDVDTQEAATTIASMVTERRERQRPDLELAAKEGLRRRW